MSKGVHSIWYLIGLQLVVYGVLITGTGIWELFSPPVQKVDLAWLHPAIWWGALLLALGAYYVWRFHGLVMGKKS